MTKPVYLNRTHIYILENCRYRAGFAYVKCDVGHMWRRGQARAATLTGIGGGKARQGVRHDFLCFLQHDLWLVHVMALHKIQT